jgi:hypothetical protein
MPLSPQNISHTRKDFKWKLKPKWSLYFISCTICYTTKYFWEKWRYVQALCQNIGYVRQLWIIMRFSELCHRPVTAPVLKIERNGSKCRRRYLMSIFIKIHWEIWKMKHADKYKRSPDYASILWISGKKYTTYISHESCHKQGQLRPYNNVS